MRCKQACPFHVRSFDTLTSRDGHKSTMSKKRDDWNGGGGGSGGGGGRGGNGGSRITTIDRMQGGSASEWYYA